MNMLTVLLWCLTVTVSLRASNTLDIDDIRLANGTGPYSGRVEVSINGVWGTICDDSFDMREARVLCRMMNLQAAAILPGAWFGEGTGPIYAQRLQCNGYESHPKYCSYVHNVQCRHARDIGIVCTECSEIEIKNGNVIDVSANGTIMTARCNAGFSSNITTSTCINGLWSPNSITCKYDITAVRLANGLGLYDGRIELLVNGTWGTVCSSSFYASEARAVCSVLFGSTSYRNYETSSYDYGRGTGPVHIDRLDCTGSETDINECSFSLDVSCTDHSRDAAVACNVIPLNVTATRLVNGTGPYDGRIELNVDGHWGTICNRNIDVFDAETICNTLNSSFTTYFTTAVYGQGTGPVLIDYIYCGSSRDQLTDCTMYQPYRPYCTHNYDLSIVCTPCGQPQIDNGEVSSFNNTDIIVKCRPGSFPEFIYMRCLSNGTWVENQRCTSYNDIDAIRLVNGLGLYDGRIELLKNGSWGTICSSSFSAPEARAVCNILFGSTSYRAYNGDSYYYGQYYYGQGTGPIHIDSLDCTGSETDINECSYSLDISCSDHSRDAAVACNVIPLNITAARLIDGTGPYDGRIELNVDGQWGTICNRNIDVFDVQTICNTLNASLTMYFTTAVYGQGTGPVLIDYLNCGSGRDQLTDCTIYQPYRPYCTHNYDLSIVCTPCGLPQIYNGEAFSFNNTDLIVKCQPGFFHEFIKMRCLNNGTWIEDPRCTQYSVYPLDIKDIRLNYYYLPSEGRVEILVNGTWGTVCDTNFDSMDASVICRMFGWEYKQHYLKASRFGRGSGAIFVDNLNCTGTESHINNCSYDVSNNCTHYDDVGVVCTGYQHNITNIRLAGTTGPYHGRVELEVNGTWGTVCDTYFYTSEARVICRMLGLAYRTYFHNAYYGQGSGPIYVDRLDCYSGYAHINYCKYAVNNYYNCDHDDDVSVMCYGPKLNITDARLANGTGPYDGRAEIKVNDTWGTICDINFNMLAADYFCNLLGFRATQIIIGAIYGEGTGPVFIDQIFCDRYDGELSNCQYLYLNECSHDRDVSVVCNECGQPEINFWDAGFFTYNGTTLYADCSYYRTYVGTLRLTCDNETQTWVTEGECQEYSYPLNVTDVRLTGGPLPSVGRIELKSLDSWGTICDDNFGMSEANVICNMIGYPPAVTYRTGAYYGEGKGPIFVDDLRCGENALQLNDCIYKTYDDCTHSDDISVVCTDCGDPTPENGYVNSSSTRYQTAVHVSCDMNYELIGDTDIVCQLNATWSRTPICKLIDCGDPTPEHGSSNSTATINASVVQIECDEGYNMSGEAFIMCQPNGNWSDYPSCAIIDCNLPEPVNADVTLTNNKTTFGETAVITCLEGHAPSGYGSATVSCLANGTWEVWIQCIPVDCGRFIPNKGSANTTDTTYGTVAKVSCPEDYNITGDSVIICQADGTWTDSPVCDESDCGFLSVANGVANTTLGTTPGSVATIECDEGYNLNGTSVVVCTSSGWNDSSVACEIQECGDPTPNNGKVSSTDGSNGYLFRNYVEIECNVGYDIEGNSVITCNDGGIWSDQPSCILKDCGSLASPENGHMDNSQGTKYNAQIIFSCNKGYLLVGNKQISCNDDGDWTHPVPTCVRKSDVGESCQSKEYCLFEDSLCTNSICTCLTGIYDKTLKICDIMPLLPFGPSAGDTTIPRKKGCGAVSFELGFPTFENTHKDVYICWYGYLSLDLIYANPTPPRNRKGLTAIQRKNILAALNAPISIQKSGAVYYRSFDIRSSYEKMKENRKDISYIEMIVRKMGNLELYDASFVLIATWDKVKPLEGFDTSKTSTFQAVLISDGKTTYVLYIYAHGEMEWSNIVSTEPPAWVGYTVDSIINSHPYSFTDSVLHLDSKLTVSSSENDVAGLVFNQLTQPGKKHDNPGVDCLNWYNENYPDKKKLDFIASMTPECPCDIWLSRFDPWFWKIGLQRWRWDITYACVDMQHVGIFGHYGKRCCYDLRSWLWVYERPLAGGFQLYNPKYPLENILNDVIPKTKCCVQSDYCNLYYELRPAGSCYKTSPYDFGTFWGDPHFRTLDGLNFTFNGLGEYVLLQVGGNKTFDLHARTARPLKEDGNFSDATIFTAFAAKDSTNASVQVELNRNKTGIILYGNKVDLTNQFYQSNNVEDPFEWTSDKGNLVISKRDETLSVLFPSFGITLNISVGVEMLSLNTLVNKTLKRRTEGLLGNYNGNPDDDYAMPNGTVLNSNLTEREVFAYGQTWEVNANNSAFSYEARKSHADYHNASYVPRFLDEQDPLKVAEAEKECNGSQNIQCVFDLVFTEKPEVALKTNEIKVQSDTTRSELDEIVPTITGCDMIRAKKGEQVTCNFTADANDEVYFVNNSVNATINRNSSVVVYTQNDVEPVNIRIASKNQKGRKSTEFILNILLCTACNNHGNCTDYPREDTKGNEYFKYATCVCEPEYEGQDCENEFDGCAANPCSLNRTCTRLTAKDQKLLGRSYNCSACPDGYLADSANLLECSDVNECSEDTDKCQQTCTNTEGSYECLCEDGYKIDVRDKRKCRDVNECEEQLHNCSHKCVNTEGSFECQCFPGYNVDTETGTCVQTENETCQLSDVLECSNTSGCTLDNDKPVCFCSDGYELDNTNKYCIDIDECSRGLCPHECVNSDGSFECVCYPGYKLDGRTICKECDVLHWGENCTKVCICTGRGADHCDNVKGCICSVGWQGDTCNEDIDECEESISLCDDARKECVNNLGSYSCECITGFTETDEGTCEDVNECLDPRLHNCSQICENTFGGYSCKCNPGYIKQNDATCIDIDECEIGLAQCEQRCVNDPGTYSCSCNYGYAISDDRRSCIKMQDPCLEINNLNCSHFCVFDDNSSQCSCRKGYRLESDNETCTDINECEENNELRCDLNADCINTNGSFLCECPVGMQLQNDGRTCSDCDNYHFGKNCMQTCSCLYGTCNKETGCVCDSGWGGQFCDTDIDECDTELLVCSELNTNCINTLGSAKCSCKTGFTNNSGVCEDINECLDIKLNTCDQICNNVEGSFFCSCSPGFILDEKCTDIDECTGSHGCDQICGNTVGSYTCFCEDGFVLNLSDRKSCRPEEECSANDTCPANSTCYRHDSKAVCACMKGYQNSSTGDICEDIDECSSELNPCSDNCSNTLGSFECSCNIGRYLTEDKVRCRDCELWKYGNNCNTDCKCNTTNTISCDPVNGQCGCKPGWSGDMCDSNINECLNPVACSENSNCSDGIGSFSCKCIDGYFKTGSGMCKECDTRHFGENCLQECKCNIDHTADCNHVTGNCDCEEGWTGDTCTDDIDECKQSTDVCSGKPNSTCKNSEGSYTCKCETGFFEDDGHCEVCKEWTYGDTCESSCACSKSQAESCNHVTGECVCSAGWNGTICDDDIDECMNNETCSEHSSCENYQGSFDCICNKGFNETDNGECQDIDECKEEGKRCSQICNNTLGSFKCSCEAGYTLQDDETTCEDVDECNETNGNCSHMCNNTIGSFICSCNTGYTLSDDKATCEECDTPYYGSNCSEICACQMQNTENCNHITGKCTCMEGWEGVTCSECIDECLINATLCQNKANSTCKNTNGSYQCACDEGFREQADICTECDLWKYGNSCQSNCTCDRVKSLNCDPGNGSCTCYLGWNGTNCEVDVNECDNDGVCPKHSSCFNTVGSFYCNCSKGYKRTAPDVCEKCGGNTYGENCTGECNCLVENSANEAQSCDTMTGMCQCKPTWTGQNCSEDVNECEENETLCTEDENKTCLNKDGSFECDCIRGFSKNSDGGCVKDVVQTTQTPAVGGIALDLTMKIDYDLPPGTNLMASSTYDELRKNIVSSIMEFLSLFGVESVQVIINDIRNGSILVNSTIIYDTKESNTGSQLTKAILELQKGSSLLFYGQNVSVSSDSYKDMEQCEIFIKTIGSCEDGYSCKLEDDGPVCQPVKNEGINLFMVIGLSVAGVFLLVVTVVLLNLAWKCMRRPRRIPKYEQRQYEARNKGYTFSREDDDADSFYRAQTFGKGEIVNAGTRYPSVDSSLSRVLQPDGQRQFSHPYHIPRPKMV